METGRREIGLGVMGRNMSLKMPDNGFRAMI
jgi:6-phosphogluconate dehydrogenase